MNISVPLPDKDYKILVRCITYNQSKYICDALNGFAIQETDFPFICIVVDDASKDGNQEVIKQYANDNCDMSKAEISEDDISTYIRVSHKTNSNCVFLFCLLKINLYCKPEKQEIYRPYREVCEYEALCEGDDYWIDEQKLKKQVKVMDDNDACMLSFHSINEIYENNHERDHVRCHVENREYSGMEWYKKRPSQYASFVIRTSLFKDSFYMDNVVGKFSAGDIPMVIYCSKIGKLIGCSDVMSVYRHNEGGWTAKKLTKEEINKRLNLHLRYSIFGKEYEEASKFFFQRDCIGIFVSSLLKGNLNFNLLIKSIKVSLSGTIRCFWLVLNRKHV